MSIQGHHLNEVAQMNPPEDELCDIDILVFAESDECRKEPHFHFCKGIIGNEYKYVVDIEVQIRDIDKMIILSSKNRKYNLELFRRIASKNGRMAQ
jgi:hypothetical protein